MQVTRSSIDTAKGPGDWSEHDVVHWLPPVSDQEYAVAPAAP